MKLIAPIVLFLIASVWTPLSADEPPKQCDRPLWTTSVKGEIGGTPVFPNKKVNARRTAALTFLDDHLLLFFQVQNTGHLSSRDALSPSSSFRLHLMLIDAESGKPTATKDLPTGSRGSSVQITSGGIVARTGADLVFLSKKLEEVLRAPVGQETSELRLSSSPSRGSLLINVYDHKNSSLALRDGRTWQVKATWNEPRGLRPDLYSISDLGMVATDTNQQQFWVTAFGSTQWKPLGPTYKIGCLGTPTFISDENVVADVCNKLTRFQLSGPVSIIDQPKAKETLEEYEITTAWNGRTFAVVLTQGNGGGWWDRDVKRVGTRIAVYDLASKEQTLTESLDSGVKHYDFVLSPNGSKLATLQDDKLSVCSVPNNGLQRSMAPNRSGFQ